MDVNLRLPTQYHDQLREKCAVFGVFGAGNEASRVILSGLLALQHRGQESSGIASVQDDGKIHRHIRPGLVDTARYEEKMQQLPGSIAIGHNRYSTSGGSEDAHGQPIITNNHRFALAHNGNLPLVDDLAEFLGESDINHTGLNDSEMMAEAIGCYMDNGLELEEAVKQAYPLFTGAFCLLIMGQNKLIAVRDSCGIRPLVIGKLGDGYVVGSETCAFDAVGAKLLRDVRPGEMVAIDDSGLTSHQIEPGKLKLDIVELIYLARPDSILDGMSVYKVRQNFGTELAKEFKIDADIVVPMPDSAIPAAIGYARASGIPFEMALNKNRYIHRTFIAPSQGQRDRDSNMKLNPMRDVLKDKRVILIDDSIFRGTSTRNIVKKIVDAGAKEVHVLISSPPIRYPDFYGLDIADQKELIAANYSVEEIRLQLKATSLGYLSYDGMIRATGRPAGDFCTACFDGVYPINIGRRAKTINIDPDLAGVYPKLRDDPDPTVRTLGEGKLLLETMAYEGA